MVDCFSRLGAPKWRRVLESLSANLVLPLAILDDKSDRLLFLSDATPNFCLNTMPFAEDTCRLCREGILGQGFSQTTGGAKCFQCYCGLTYLVSAIGRGNGGYLTMVAGAFYTQAREEGIASEIAAFTCNVPDEFRNFCFKMPVLTQAKVEEKRKALEYIRNHLEYLLEDIVQGHKVYLDGNLLDSLLELNPQDPQELIFGTMADTILSIPGLDAGISIGTISRDENRIKIVYSKGDTSLDIVENAGISRWVLREKQYLVIRDITRDPRLPWSIKEQLADLAQLICFPVFVQRSIYALLYVGSRQSQPLNQMVFQCLEKVARMGALLIEASKSQGYLAKRRHQMTAFSEAIRITNSGLALETVLELILDLLTSVFDIPILNLSLKGDNGNENALKIKRDVSPQKLNSWETERNVEGNDSSLMRFPLTAKEDTIGLLRLGLTSSLGEEDLEFIKGLCDLIGIAAFNNHISGKMQSTNNGIIQALMRAIEMRDPYTRGHSERVGSYAAAVAGQLGLEQGAEQKLQWAGYLHDLGKIVVPEKVLNKCGKLSEREMELIRQHPTIGAQILEVIPELRFLVPVIRAHHERLDGTGYPDGLVGEQIPFEAQILAVTDAYDALTSKRAYRGAYSSYEALQLLRQQPDHLNQRIVAALGEVVKDDLFLGDNKLITVKSLNTETEKTVVSLPSLTQRELEVLGLVAEGLKNKEIAASLYISEKTVKTHITNILRKLNVSDRTRAAVLALEAGLLKTIPTR